jgi:hypothetical protein
MPVIYLTSIATLHFALSAAASSSFYEYWWSGQRLVANSRLEQSQKVEIDVFWRTDFL